jgi:ribonuclease J
VVNGLINQGVDVISDRTHLVHVSGHPRRAELADMLAWVKPAVVVPAHGEALHLAEHAEIARRAGTKAITCRNGDLVRLAPEPAIIDQLPAGRLYKDGKLLVAADGRTVADRRRLSFAGFASIALAITENGVLAAGPDVELVGIPENGSNGDSLEMVARDAVMETFASLSRPQRRDPDALAESVRRAVRAALAAQWDKKATCHVHVLVI